MKVQSVQTNYLISAKSNLQKRKMLSKQNGVVFKGLLPKGITKWDILISGVIGSATGGIGGVMYLAMKKGLYESSKFYHKKEDE